MKRKIEKISDFEGYVSSENLKFRSKNSSSAAASAPMSALFERIQSKRKFAL
jgi:hypothetical protein